MRKYRGWNTHREILKSKKSKRTFEHGTGDRVIDERPELKLPKIYVAKDWVDHIWFVLELMNQRRFGRERPWKFGRFGSGTGTFNDLHVVLQREKFFIIRNFLDTPRASRPTSYFTRKIIDFKQKQLLSFITNRNLRLALLIILVKFIPFRRIFSIQIIINVNRIVETLSPSQYSFIGFLTSISVWNGRLS